MNISEMDRGINDSRPFEMMGPSIHSMTPDQLRLIRESVNNGYAVEIEIGSKSITGNRGLDYWRAKQNLFTSRLEVDAKLQADAKIFNRLPIDPVAVQASVGDTTMMWIGPISLLNPQRSAHPVAAQT